MLNSRRLLPLFTSIVWSLFCTFVVASKKSYHGYSVFQLLPQTENHLRQLTWLVDGTSYEVQYWREPVAVNQTVELLVSPKHRRKLESIFQDRWSIPSRVTIPDVGQLIERESTCDIGANTRAGDNDVFYRSFHSYASIERRLTSLAENSPSIRMESSVIGKSYEGRNIYLIKVSSDPNAERPVIFIDAAHHAREWISVSTMVYLIESLVNENVAKHSYQWKTRLDLANFDYWFVPLINPDGYEFSRTRDRMWRKTRSPPKRNVWCGRGASSWGVDPNRNYPFHWRGQGTSRDPCSEIYAGESPLSEPETRTLAETLEANKDRILFYISMHTYSQMIAIPFAYEVNRWCVRYRDMLDIGESFAKAVYSFDRTRYQYGNTAAMLGPGSGGSDDFANGQVGIKYTCTMELPDKGRYGFIMPASWILSIGQQTLIGIRAMTDTLLKIGRTRRQQDE